MVEASTRPARAPGRNLGEKILTVPASRSARTPLPDVGDARRQDDRRSTPDCARVGRQRGLSAGPDTDAGRGEVGHLHGGAAAQVGIHGAGQYTNFRGDHSSTWANSIMLGNATDTGKFGLSGARETGNLGAASSLGRRRCQRRGRGYGVLVGNYGCPTRPCRGHRLSKERR